MKIRWFYLVAAVVMSRAFCPGQQTDNGPAVTTLAYENGSIANNIYTNECFGISLAVPEGWRIDSQHLGVEERARHTQKGALLLLLADQKKEGTSFSTLAFGAFDASLYSPTLPEFVSHYAREHINSDPEHREAVKETYSVEYAGRTFFRADNKQPMGDGRTLYVAFVYTKFRGYYLGGFVSADSPEGLDQAANSLQGLSFRENTPNPKCIMTGDENSKPGGVLGGVITSKPPLKPGQPQRVRVSQGVSTGLLTTKVQPQYPDDAKQARIQGQVVLQAEISKTGDILDLALISGHPMLAPAAIEAVKQWKYKPYLLNGEPMNVETQVTVNFVLSGH
ncbi:MAG: energy transducer TonB [Terriglobales bacterium]